MSYHRACDTCGKELTPHKFVETIPVSPSDRPKEPGGQVQVRFQMGGTRDFCDRQCLLMFLIHPSQK